MPAISALKTRAPVPVLRALRWLIPASSTALLLALGLHALHAYYGIDFTARGELTEFCAELLIAYLLFAVSRRIWLFLLLQAVFTALLLFANAAKIQALEAPIVPADFSAIHELFDVLSGWRFFLALAPLVLIPLLFILNLRLSVRSAAVILAAGLCAWLLLGPMAGACYRQVDTGYDYRRTFPMYNFVRRGPALFLFAEIARKHADTPPIPDRHQVDALLDSEGLNTRPATTPAPAPTRDVYIILMETLWDPTLLKSVHFSNDPMAPGFRKLWRAGGPSWALTPTFGAGTANAEFEALCGMPITSSDYWVFVTTLVQDMPCLPRLLAQHGYQTIASVPESKAFFNVSVAYRHVGFERFYPGEAFDLDDLNGRFLSNVSFFRQSDEHLTALNAHPPTLNYLVTFSGHYPFQINTALRPPRIKSADAGSLPLSYANLVWYDTQEAADYIDKVRRRDPNAVIVLFGDHLPVLGTDSGVYVRSGLLPADESKASPEQIRLHYRTPLLVIDGRAGPLDVGDAPLYTLPDLILRLIGYRQPRIMQAFLPPQGSVIRPSRGRLLLLKDGQSYLCEAAAPDDPHCGSAKQWFARSQVLSTDLLLGKQYTATDLLGPGYSTVLPKVPYGYLGENYKGSCELRVLHWGPQRTQMGQPFHPGADGSSVFWLMFDKPPAHLQLWLGKDELKVTNYPKLTTAGLYDDSILSKPGSLPLTYDCNDSGIRHKAGDFTVLPAAHGKGG